MHDDIVLIEPGPRYSQAVVHNGLIYLCGQVGAPNASIADQTQGALDNIDRLLALSGSDKTRILQVTIWITDIGHLADMTAVYEKWMPAGAMPARATVASALVPNYDVEIMLTAAQYPKPGN